MIDAILRDPLELPKISQPLSGPIPNPLIFCRLFSEILIVLPTIFCSCPILYNDTRDLWNIKVIFPPTQHQVFKEAPIRLRELEGYVHQHHLVPKSSGKSWAGNDLFGETFRHIFVILVKFKVDKEADVVDLIILILKKKDTFTLREHKMYFEKCTCNVFT